MNETIKEYIEKCIKELKNSRVEIAAIITMLALYAIIAKYSLGIIITITVIAGVWQTAELIDGIALYLNKEILEGVEADSDED